MGSSQPPSLNPDDYSAATTLITFPRPLPLIRHPVTAAPSDNPCVGPYTLAFKNPHEWVSTYHSSKSQIISQCESGARIGCSISASDKCKPPWWTFLLGTSTKQDLNERVKCEEIEMEACFLAAKERCVLFAKQKCEPAFMNARIGTNSLGLGTEDRKEIFTLISEVCSVSKRNNHRAEADMYKVDKSWGEICRKYEATTVRGNELLGSNYADIEGYKDYNTP